MKGIPINTSIKVIMNDSRFSSNVIHTYWTLVWTRLITIFVHPYFLMKLTIMNKKNEGLSSIKCNVYINNASAGSIES